MSCQGRLQSILCTFPFRLGLVRSPIFGILLSTGRWAFHKDKVPSNPRQLSGFAFSIFALHVEPKLVLLLFSCFIVCPSKWKGTFSQESKEVMASSPDQTHRFQNGRRYHTFEEGTYYLPNDEEEAMRLGERVRCLELPLPW